MKMENRDDFEKKIKKFQFLPSKYPLKLAISEGIFHFCEKNLQKGVGKYTFKSFIGRGTIILKILPQRCPLLPVSVQSM